MTDQAEPYVRAADEIRRLAETHDTDLDAFARRVGYGLRGPAGHRIFDETRGHRNGLHQAFQRAWEDVAALARRHGGSTGAGPYLATAGFGGYAGGSLRGVDEDAVRQAMREAKNHGAALCDAGRRLAGILSRVGVNPSPGHQVQELGDWLLGQDRELRHRLDQALAAEAVMGDAFAGLGSGVPTLAERLGRLSDAQHGELARLHQINGLPLGRERAQKTAAWWRTLSEADRRRFTELFPRTIGGLDGLPSLSRHLANERVLKTDQRRLQARLDTLPWTDASGDPVNVLERDRIEKQLAVLTVIQSEIRKMNFDAKGDPKKNEDTWAYLLGLDIDHRKVIFSYGNPDTADNITTFVPGFGTTITSTQDNLKRAADTRTFALAADRSHSTASIYWLDYPTPLAFDVLTPGNADDGGPRLGAFQRGLEAARLGREAHTTLLGHSYGSLACGRAAVRFPKIADELVFVGSPGVAVDRAEQLRVSPQHIWASATDNDPVTGAPPFPWILIPGGRKYAEEQGLGVFGSDPTQRASVGAPSTPRPAPRGPVDSVVSTRTPSTGIPIPPPS
ncbi:MAG: hypothetical protein GEV11_14075 [Streptosporangiales bacterium]|nr:hypothetical protein [Streptosporangiales bacterium]